MKKDVFIKIMNEWKDLLGVEREVDTALRKFCPDFSGFSMSRYSNMIIDILKDTMNDESDWISYYVWELEWGKNSERLKVTMNGKSIPLKTLDDLWNILHNTCEHEKDLRDLIYLHGKILLNLYNVLEEDIDKDPLVLNAFCNLLLYDIEKKYAKNCGVCKPKTS